MLRAHAARGRAEQLSDDLEAARREILLLQRRLQDAKSLGEAEKDSYEALQAQRIERLAREKEDLEAKARPRAEHKGDVQKRRASHAEPAAARSRAVEKRV